VTSSPNWELLPSQSNMVRGGQTLQPIAGRALPDQWYVGAGDLLWAFEDQNGGYDIPQSVRVGKVFKLGDPRRGRRVAPASGVPSFLCSAH